jgi:hypothetical protein
MLVGSHRSNFTWVRTLRIALAMIGKVRCLSSFERATSASSGSLVPALRRMRGAT